MLPGFKFEEYRYSMHNVMAIVYVCYYDTENGKSDIYSPFACTWLSELTGGIGGTGGG